MYGCLTCCWWECNMIRLLAISCKTKVAQWLEYGTSSQKNENLHSQKEVCTQMFILLWRMLFFIINPNWKQSVFQLANGWTNFSIPTIVVFRAREYYSIIKRNKLLTNATSWVDLSGLVLMKCNDEKKSQSYRSQTVLFHLCTILNMTKLHKRRTV